MSRGGQPITRPVTSGQNPEGKRAFASYLHTLLGLNAKNTALFIIRAFIFAKRVFSFSRNPLPLSGLCISRSAGLPLPIESCIHPPVFARA